MPCEIQSFLGFTGWHRKFIENYAEFSAPLVNLTKKGVPFSWKNEQEEAFEKFKLAITSAPILVKPDYSKPFSVEAEFANWY